jgi:hypothetical protein
MFINSLWFIEQAWETVFKPFTMKICEVIWIFTNYLWKTGSWKREVSFFAEFITISIYLFVLLLDAISPVYMYTTVKKFGVSEI